MIFNSHAQLNQITHPTGDTLGYQYDGNLLTEVSWAGEVEGSVQYQYNSDFITNRYCINNNDCIDYSYDNDNLTLSAGDLSISRQAQQGGAISSISLNNINTAYTLNSYGELESTRSQHNSNDLYSVSYQRDLLGRITQKEETIVGNTTSHVYTYSDNGRLNQVDSNGEITQYSYDNNGNRTAKTNLNGTESGTYDDQDRLSTYNGCSYQYTDNGELQQKTCGTDITHYSYDVLGNLLNVTLPDGTTIDYIIDGQDRRIGKKVNGSLQQAWLYGDQLNPIAELDANNNIVAQFIYATQANVPDYMIKGGITYKIISDYLGSPRLVVNASNGSIAQQIDYDEFGQITQDTNPNFQPFGFAGGLYDGDTELTRFGARDYDAGVGRWTNKDPIQFNGGDSNLYGYVLSDPINFVDLDGLQYFQVMRALRQAEVDVFTKEIPNFTTQCVKCAFNQLVGLDVFKGNKKNRDALQQATDAATHKNAKDGKMALDAIAKALEKMGRTDLAKIIRKQLARPLSAVDSAQCMGL